MNLNIGNIGVWGFRHYEFLKQNRSSTVGVMRLNGTLEGYLKEVNKKPRKCLKLSSGNTQQRKASQRHLNAQINSAGFNAWTTSATEPKRSC